MKVALKAWVQVSCLKGMRAGDLTLLPYNGSTGSSSKRHAVELTLVVQIRKSRH